MKRTVRNSFWTHVVIYFLVATATKGLSTSGHARRGGAKREVIETYFNVLRSMDTNSITWGGA